VATIATIAEVTAAWPDFADLPNMEQVGLLQAATDLVAKATGRDWETANTATTETHDGSGGPYLFLRRFPVASVGTVTVDGSRVTDYVLDATAGMLTRGESDGDPRTYEWEQGSGNISVAYIPAATTPPGLKRAAIYLVRWLSLQTSSAGMRREKIGDYEYELGGQEVTTFGQLPTVVEAMLTPYKDWRIR
jgi:hypothetical protein